MKPMFTVHVGEFLVGNFIQKKFGKKYETWIPTKDKGVDLLVTRRKGKHRPVRLQVKFSRGFHPESVPPEQIVAWGWFTLKPAKIRKSKADLWVFVVLTERHKAHFVVVPTRELRKRIPRKARGTWHLYLSTVRGKKCYDTRGLTAAEQHRLYSMDRMKDRKRRDYSQYLENWKLLNELSR